MFIYLPISDITNEPLEMVDHYVYLGQLLHTEGSQQREMKGRNSMTWSKFGKLSKYLQDKKFPPALKKKIFMRYLCDIYAIFMRYLCDIYAIFMRYLCDIYAIFMRYLCDKVGKLHKAFMIRVKILPSGTDGYWAKAEISDLRFKGVMSRSSVDALSELCSPFLKGGNSAFIAAIVSGLFPKDEYSSFE